MKEAESILTANLNRNENVIVKLHPVWDPVKNPIVFRNEALRKRLTNLRDVGIKKVFEHHEKDVEADEKDGELSVKEAKKETDRAGKTRAEFYKTIAELIAALSGVSKKAEKIAKAYAKGPDSDTETLISDCDTILDETEVRLEKIQARIAKYFQGKTNVLAKRFSSRLVKLSHGKVQRSGADVTGHGKITTKSGAKDVPPAVLEPIAAKIDVIRLIGRTGDLSEEQFELMRKFQDEIEKSIADTEKGLDSYAGMSDLTKHIEKTLAKKAFTYWLDSHQDLTERLEKIEKQVGPATTDESLKKLEKLKLEVGTEYGIAVWNEEEFERIQKEHDKTRKESLEEYMNALGKAFGVKKDAAGGKKAATIKKLPSIENYQGKYATEFSDIWSEVDKGNPKSVIIADTKTAELKAKIAKAVNELKDIGLPSVKPDDYTRVMSIALEDIENSDNEIEERKAAKEKFKVSYKKLKKFIKDESKNLAPSAREAFENNEILLRILKRRAKAASDSGEWREVQKELDAEDIAIHGYARANQKHKEEGGDKEKGGNKVKPIFDRCLKRVDEFRSDLDAFYQESVLSETKELDKIIKSGNTNSETAQVVRDLITQKKASVESLAQAIGKAMSGDNLKELSKELAKNANKTPPPDDDIKVREKALALIRRRRLFLEETTLGGRYRSNPFDFGAPAVVMIQELVDAEVQLLTQIKSR